MRAYHFLRDDFRAGEGNEAPWEVGETREINKTMRRKIVLCEYGYHFCPSLFDALMYAPGSLACLVEVPDDAEVSKEDFPKGVTYQRTLIKAVNIERELRLFAADCAEHVLYIFERKHPNDDRPRKAIHAARDFANGKIDVAAQDAAGDAAQDAAGDAAWVAAWVAAQDAAWDAARAAAWDAAGDAAWDAAWVAAQDAAWEWQRAHFDEMFAGIFDKEQSHE